MILHGYIENGTIQILEKDILQSLNRKYDVEIIVKNQNSSQNNNVMGALSKYKNIDLIEKEKDLWINTIHL
ncbi:MAG TPA: hypothetical protein PKK13_13380 [Spirochaetota bacterium]|nr:hypothetical protein [Spirochaetota bacterium]